jgi:hypothetical protein
MDELDGVSESSIVTRSKVHRTAALQRLIVSQTDINRFFWSSELSYQICLQRVLRPLTTIQRDDSVASIFFDVRANALLPPNSKKHGSHFAGTAGDFERQLRVNLRSVCEHVILDFFGDFELFLEERLTPFLIALSGTVNSRRARINDKRLVSARARGNNCLIDALKSVPFIELVETLEGLDILDAGAAGNIDGEVLLRAEGFRFLRHKLTHPESHIYGDEQSAEVALQDRVLSDKRFLKLRDLIKETSEPASTGIDTGHAETLNASQKFIIRSVFDDPESRRSKGRSDNPLIFYQAIFALRAFNRLATALDGALPLQPVLASTNTQCDSAPKTAQIAKGSAP